MERTYRKKVAVNRLVVIMSALAVASVIYTLGENWWGYFNDPSEPRLHLFTAGLAVVGWSYILYALIVSLIKNGTKKQQPPREA